MIIKVLMLLLFFTIIQHSRTAPPISLQLFS